MSREIMHEVSSYLEPIETGKLSGVEDWLNQQAISHQLHWLLVHAYDGVIWGKFDPTRSKLITSYEAAQEHKAAEDVCPPLDDDTLLQARLFSEQGELLLWRDGDGLFQARLIRDVVSSENAKNEADWIEVIDETYLLWGTSNPKPELLGNGTFSFWNHGEEGLRHAVPLTAKGEKPQPPRLKVRHYLARADHTYIECSRLFSLVE